MPDVVSAMSHWKSDSVLILYPATGFKLSEAVSLPGVTPPFIPTWIPIHIERFRNSLTLDHVLENPYPPSGNQVLRKLKANDGLLLKVNNKAILKAMRLLSQEGIFAQPASATALVGLIEAVNKKMIPPSSRVVVVVTGSGLKYPPVLKEFDISPVLVKLDQLPQALETVLK
jgi:threonine synthase